MRRKNTLFEKAPRFKRIIGSYDDGEEGPLIIALACLHGNEYLPYKAIDYVIKMLEVEHITQPKFTYQGRFLGLCGNLAAASLGRRFVDIDMNRIWTEDRLVESSSQTFMPDFYEEKELLELWNLIRKEVKRYDGDQVVFLDFHTTSAPGGIFCMPAHDEQSLHLAFDLFIPVVDGLMDSVSDSCLSFMTKEHLGKDTVAISIEVGQHSDPNSIYVAIAAVINAMRSMKAVKLEDVESRHDDILRIHSKGLPRLSKLFYIHKIKSGDKFEMLPGFKNFQMIKQGTILAYDRNGSICAPEDCILLMPLYQKQGSEGFFLIRQQSDYGVF